MKNKTVLILRNSAQDGEYLLDFLTKKKYRIFGVKKNIS